MSGTESANRFLKVVEDITEVGRARQALREESQALEILNQTAAQVAAELDLSTVVQLVTDAGVKLTRARFGAFFYNTVNEAARALCSIRYQAPTGRSFERFGHPRPRRIRSHLQRRGRGSLGRYHGRSSVREECAQPQMPEGHLPVRSYLAVVVRGPERSSAGCSSVTQKQASSLKLRSG